MGWAHAGGGVMCLTGISTRTDAIGVPMAQLNRQLVMGNAVIVGSVNAAKRHYATAVDALAAADRSWLERLVSRTVPLSDWPSALNKTPDDIKVAVDLQD
jgi:glucose 1-dehydrogenase